MSSRSFRLETRSRARDEIKRIMQTVEKVRKWEKIWIETGLSNHLKVYKWVPVREEVKDELGKMSKKQEVEDNETDSTLPEIKTSKELGMEAPQLSTGQLPPDLLLASETIKHDVIITSSTNDGGVVNTEQKKIDLEKRKGRQTSPVAMDTEANIIRPRSPH